MNLLDSYRRSWRFWTVYEAIDLVVWWGRRALIVLIVADVVAQLAN